MHVAEAIAAAGFEVMRVGASATAMRCVRPGRHNDCRSVPLLRFSATAHAAEKRCRAGLRHSKRVAPRGASERRYVRKVHERASRDLGIDDGTSQEIGGGGRPMQQRRRNQATAGIPLRAIVRACFRTRATLSGRAINSHWSTFLLRPARPGPRRELARTVAPRPMMPRRAISESVDASRDRRLIGLTLCAQDAVGEPYPDRPIRLISPNPAGGANDTIVRIIAGRCPYSRSS